MVWTESEEFLLESMLGSYRVSAIAKKLKRKPCTVHKKIQRMGLSVVPNLDSWSAPDFAKLIGVERHTVYEWINRGELIAKKSGRKKCCPYTIKRADFVEFYDKYKKVKPSLSQIDPAILEWLRQC